MHFLLTLLIGAGILIGCFLAPFLLGLPVVMYARARGYMSYFHPEDSWIVGMLVIFALGLAYCIGSIFV